LFRKYSPSSVLVVDTSASMPAVHVLSPPPYRTRPYVRETRSDDVERESEAPICTRSIERGVAWRGALCELVDCCETRCDRAGFVICIPWRDTTTISLVLLLLLLLLPPRSAATTYSRPPAVSVLLLEIYVRLITRAIIRLEKSIER